LTKGLGANEELNSDGRRADSADYLISDGVLIDIHPHLVKFIPDAELDCIVRRPESDIVRRPESDIVRRSDFDDRRKPNDLFHSPEHWREQERGDLPDAAPDPDARPRRRGHGNHLRHLLPAESWPKYLLDGRIPRGFAVVRQRVSNPASRRPRSDGLQPGAAPAGATGPVRPAHRRRVHPRYRMLEQLEDSRCAGLPAQPDHLDPAVQHHWCMWPDSGPRVGGLERARIGRSGVGLGRVVSDLLERKGREFGGELA